MRTGKKLEQMNKYLTVVAAVGFVGLLVSLFLMTEFLGPVKKIVSHMMESIIGSR